VWVEVENHMGISLPSEILLKVTNGTIPTLPVKADANTTYERTLENGEKWETLSTISINEPGNYSVIFELWAYDEKVGALQFSGNFVVLNIEFVDQV
jgi:predicted  nucleic acid-binding Zn-ribbon protein